MRKFLLLLPLLLFCSARPAKAQTQVDSCLQANTATNSAICTFTNNITSGALMMVYAYAQDSGLSSCSAVMSIVDSASSSWTTNACRYNGADASHHIEAQSFYVCAAGSGGGKTITITWPATYGDVRVVADEITGTAATSCPDVHAGGTGGSGSSVLPAGGALTTTNATDVVVCVASAGFNLGTWQAGNVHTGGPAYNLRVGGFQTRIAIEDVNVTVTASNYDCGVSSNSTLGSWIAEVWAFKAASVSTFVPQIGGFLVGP